MVEEIAARAQQLEDPPMAKALFGSTRLAPAWLVIRLYVGYEWVAAGLHKLGDPAWTSTGLALKGFWERAVLVPDAPARPVIGYGWYRDFLQTLLDGGHYTWFAKLIVAGELAVGIALILGAFTGIAAFSGSFMSWNFMMAGTASINPLMFTFSILLMLAWKTAGWWGADRYLLPLLGTPWKPGKALVRVELVG